jgi:hypothetical protein
MVRPAVVIASILGLSACKDVDTKDVDDDVCTPLPKEPCIPPPPPGTSTGETGGEETAGDETAGGDTGGPKELGPDACVHNVTEGVVGYRLQCEGKLFTTLEFELPLGHDCESTLGAAYCSQYHAFGPSNDTYEAPDVMACCGEAWDHQYGDVYLEHCTYDLIQQVCISLAKRLEIYILDGAFATHAGQAAALQIWVAENYEECFNTLLHNDSNFDPAALESSWKIPNSPAWGAIDDMVLYIDAGTESTGVFRPESPLDWIPCNGANGNNDEIFKDTTTPNGGIVAGVDLSADVLGELVGPAIFGGTVSASATFETSCLSHGCPTAMFSYDADDTAFTLEALSLYTHSFVVTNGVAWLTVERARIELWGQAVGTVKHDPDGRLLGYAIPAGEARFLLAGASDGYHNQFIGSNATDIEISVVEEDWLIHSFVIGYEDGSGHNWSLTLGESRWQ